MSSKLSVIIVLAIGFSSCTREEITQPEQTDIMDAVFASGNIISEREYRVTANTEGYLMKSFVEEGVRIEAGMPLFQLSNEVQSEQLSNAEILYRDALKNASPESPQRAQAELKLEQSKSQLALDKKNFERYEKLLESKAVSQLEHHNMKLQYENALRNVAMNEKSLQDLINTLEISVENAKTQVVIQKQNNDDYFLSSNIKGEVLQVYKEEGDLVKRGEVVALVGGGKKQAKLFVSEEDIKEIKLRQQVVLNLNTEKDKTYEGVVSKIYPAFDDLEQSFIVEATFTDVPQVLFCNTQLQANIIIGQREGALVIPSGFLSDGDSVLIKNGDLKFVKVGIRNDQWVEVLEGISEEDILKKPAAL